MIVAQEMRRSPAEDARDLLAEGAAPPGPGSRRGAARIVAALAFGLFAVLLLILVGRPLSTDDLWFHLEMGEVYGTETLWPEVDPMLHTAGDRRPVQHEWLFGVVVFALERAIGFQGLRVVHVLAVAGIVALAWASLRRESQGALPALFATCVFLFLSWRRLYQLRPDLISIPATILTAQLLFAVRGGLSWRRVALATGLIGLWANFHSLFAIGLVLGLAGWLGMRVRALLARRLPPEPGALPEPTGRRVAVAVGLGFVAALVNPRGIAQHLTFLTSARESSIWLVKDEWTPLRPFVAPGKGSAGIDLLAWGTADALLVLLLVVAVVGGIAFLRRPTRERLHAIDPVLGALAFASACAMLVSIRFLWMGFFVLLFLLRAHRWGLASYPRATRPLDWAMAVGAVLLAVAFLRLDAWRGLAVEIRREPGDYFRTSYLARRYCASGIRFVEEAGLEGNLFNPYHVGGYAGYRLAPRVRTFIDGRTEHYPPDVARDYLEIVGASSRSDRRTAVELLDAREVDIFLGVGVPEGYYGGLYTVELLARRPDWILVYRTVDHAVYLRRNARNVENLGRVVQYYYERRVPFDSRSGFSPRDVIREAPEWALAQAMIPPGFAELEAKREGPDPAERFRALDAIGTTYWLLGEARAQIEADLAASALRPDAREPRRRLANTYLRQRRFREAEKLARELYESDPTDARTKTLYEFLLEQRYSR